jgi:hypothetical protein
VISENIRYRATVCLPTRRGHAAHMRSSASRREVAALQRSEEKAENGNEKAAKREHDIVADRSQRLHPSFPFEMLNSGFPLIAREAEGVGVEIFTA